MTCYHGVYDFYMAKNLLLKLIWLIAVVLGCFFAVNQSVEFILDFALEDEWQASVSSETPSNGLMTWPNITVCTPSTFSASKLRGYGFTDPYEVAYLAGGSTGAAFYHELLADPPFRGNLSTELERNISRRVMEKSVDINEVRPRLWSHTWPVRALSWFQSLSPNCDDLIIHCGRNQGADRNLSCNCKEISVESDRPGCFMINPMKIGHRFEEFMRPGKDPLALCPPSLTHQTPLQGMSPASNSC